MSISVMIVDDDELILSSLSIIIGMTPDIRVVAALKNGEEATRYIIDNGNVNVILMDIRMPVCDGVLATKRIIELFPDSKIIILTTFDDDRFIFEALKNGAKGYLLKNIPPDKIIEAIRVVFSGSMLLHSNAASKVAEMLHKKKVISFDEYGLTNSEVEIIKLISEGHTNKEISETIYLSEGTVKNKISEILDKLQLRDRTQIAIFYLKGGRMT